MACWSLIFEVDMKIRDLKERYFSIFGEDGVPQNGIDDIEKELNIQLPEDFKQIASFYSGGLVGDCSLHEIAKEGVATNIVQETLRLRVSINLPSQFVVLAEPPESLILLDTSRGRNEVLWCDATDVHNLASYDFIAKPDTWSTYSEFFESILVDEEENQG
jgi:SUKH superfamily protein